MSGEARSSKGDCEDCLEYLKEYCPPIYVGLAEGLRFLPPATQASYLRLVRRLVQLAPKNWSKNDPDLSDRSEQLHNANVRLVKRLEYRYRFCGLRATYYFDRIERLCEKSANGLGREGRSYSFAAHRIVRLVGSIMRAETAELGPCGVLYLPERKPAPESDPPPVDAPLRLAKVLPFKRPS